MAWYQRHKVITGALAGAVAGSVIPGLGNLVGAVIGAVVGPAVIDDEQHPGWFKLRSEDKEDG